MSKQIDQSELSKIIAAQKGIDQKTINAFIQQLFKSFEKKLVTDSFATIKGLGQFRIIKSGDSKKILFIGTKQEKLSDKDDIASKNIYQNKTSIDPSNRDLLSDEEILVNNINKIPIENRPKTTNSNKKANVSPDRNLNKGEGDIDLSRQQEIAEMYYSPDMTNRSKTPIYIGIGILFVLMLGTVIYNLSSSSGKSSILEYSLEDNRTRSTRIARFPEVNNTDAINYSCVIIIDTDISLKDLSKIYYGKELFWPYIYKANKYIIDNNFVVPSNSIVKIPKLTVDLVDYSTGVLDSKLKTLEEEIIREARTGLK